MRFVAFAPALLAPALLAASPALAQAAQPPARHPAVSADAAAQVLNDPAAQNVIALQIASLAGIVLDARVGALAPLTDPREGVRPGDTLRSLAERRDPAFERHLYEGSRRAVAGAGAVAAQAAELRRTADRLRAALAPLVGAAASLGGGQ